MHSLLRCQSLLAALLVLLTVNIPGALAQGTTNFVNVLAVGNTENGFGGWIGIQFTVGNQALTVTHLGRFMVAGNSGVHRMKLVVAQNTLDVPNASVNVPMSGGTPGAFVYAELAAPVTLSPNTSYYLVSEESIGGDRWHTLKDTTITNINNLVGILNSAVFQGGGFGWSPVGTPGAAYGPVGFLHQIQPIVIPPVPIVTLTSPLNGASYNSPATVALAADSSPGTTLVEFFNNTTKLGEDNSGPPFTFTWNNVQNGNHSLTARATNSGGNSATSPPVNITVTSASTIPGVNYVQSSTLGTVRNNFSGFIGMKFTVGPAPLSITALGRMFLPGNNGSHLLKLVLETDGSDVPGASVTVPSAGGVPNQIQYAALPNPVNLAANTSYYLVSREFEGGDSWYDVNSTVVTAPVATLNSGAYKIDTDPYAVTAGPNNTYGILDFKYQPGTGPQPPAVAIVNPAAGSSFVPSSVINIDAVADDGVTNVIFFVDGTEIGRDSSAPFGITLPAPAAGTHQLTARAISTNGLAGNSIAINITINPGLPGGEMTFVASTIPNVALNGFNGWIGYRFTVGPLPLRVTALGRMFAPGNTQNHPMRIVRVSDLADVATTTVASTGGTAGQFNYAPLTTPVTLSPNTRYYLASQEMAGGDRWHDRNSSIIPRPVGTLDGAVFFDGTGWFFIDDNDVGYGPLDFKFDAGDVPPTINIITPPSGTRFAAPATLTVTAASTTGTTLVEFFRNGSKVGDDTTAPYAVTQNNVPAGTYLFTATATADNGLMATSAPVTLIVTNLPVLPPTITMGSPAHGSSFAAPATIPLGAIASPETTLVEFFQNDISLGSDSVPPFQLTLNNVIAGSYTYTAQATGNEGLMTTSSPVTITVTNAAATAVTIISPLDGRRFNNPTTILIEAVTSGNITNVQFLRNATPLGSDTTPPFAYTWTTPLPGEHDLTAKATDALGISVTSAVVHISITTNAADAKQNFITDASLGITRNDFTGFLGMTFTVGPNPLTVTELSRMMVQDNTGSHLLKLVHAGNDTDVPGGSVSVSMTGGTPGQFKSEPLPTPVVLAAGQTYYLVSQETENGDRWHNVSDTFLTSTDVATIDSGVFGPPPWSGGGLPNQSYVPVNFCYLAEAGASPPTISLTHPLNLASFIAPASILLEATASAGVTHVAFYNGAEQLGESTSTPHQFNWTSPPGGSHPLTAVATAPNGLIATSAVVTVSIASTNASDVQAELITSTTTGNLRNDYTGSLGIKFTVGEQPLLVTQLGRWMVPGNSNSHLLKLVSTADGADLPGASVTVSMTGATPNQYLYAPLPNPVILPANTSFYLVSEETAGGDQWHQLDTIVLPAPVATLNGPVFGGPPWSESVSPNNSFIPVNLRFLTSAPAEAVTVSISTPLNGTTLLNPTSLDITALTSTNAQSVQFFDGPTPLGTDNNTPFTLTLNNPASGNHPLTAIATGPGGITATSTVINVSVIITNPSDIETPLITHTLTGVLRNDFNGFLGMHFTVGNEPLLVSQLGRMMVNGNSGSHLVKLVRISTATDVPGGSVTISMSGGTPGQYLYAPLPNPVILAANTRYYLVSQESIDGDQWHQLDSVVTPSAAATIGGPVFGNTTWTESASPNNSFVPVNLQHFTEAPPAPINVAITSPINGTTLLNPASLDITALTSTNAQSVQFFDGPTPLGTDNITPFTFTLNNPASGNHPLSAIATGPGGITATSAVINVSVIITNSSDVLTPFVTNTLAGSLRNDFTGFIGMKFTVGNEALLVARLGRLMVAGNSQEHAVKLVRASDGTDVPGGTVSIPMNGAVPGQYKYEPLPNPVTLAANTLYYLVSQETAGGDQWHQLDSIVTPSNAGTINGPVFADSPWTESVSPNRAFVTVNFEYLDSPPFSLAISSPTPGSTFLSPSAIEITTTTSASAETVDFFAGSLLLGTATTPPFSFTWNTPPSGTHHLTVQATATGGSTITSAVVTVTVVLTNASDTIAAFIQDTLPGSLRNNFTGFAGMQITIGPNPVTVTELGRLFVTGNSNEHTVKIVSAATGLDLPNGSVTLPPGAGTPGEFQYAPLTQPLVLAANTAYYLLSSETVGGDQWHELDTTLLPDPVGAINGPVFGNGPGTWTVTAFANHGFGPLDLKFRKPAAPTIAITSPANGATLIGTGSIEITTSTSTGTTLVEFFEDGNKIGENNSAPFNLIWPAPLGGNYILSARATAANGIMATSDPVNIMVVLTNETDIETAFIIETTAGPLRNNFSGFLGILITVGDQPLLVTSLGRFAVAGNSLNHIVKLVRASDGLEVPGGSVTVNMAAATPDEYVYGRLPGAVLLNPNTGYYLVSEETNGGDQWHDAATILIPNTSGTVDGPVFKATGGGWVLSAQSNQGFVPVNLNYLSPPVDLPPTVAITSPASGSSFANPPQITINTTTSPDVTLVEFFSATIKLGEDASSPFSFTWTNPPVGNHLLTARATSSPGLMQTSTAVSIDIVTTNVSQVGRPFVVNTAPGSLRNDFDGLLGMKITIGPSPLIISALGRYVVQGNTDTHDLSLVRVSDLTSVPGTAVTIDTAGASAGEYLYQSLPAPVVLSANTMYYLVSSETAGGDQWHQLDSIVIPAPVGTIDGSVFNNPLFPWSFSVSPNHAFGPVNMIYLAEQLPDPPSLTISRNGDALTLTLIGTPGETYTVEFSPDFLTWTPLGTFTLTGTSMTIPNPGTAPAAVRFYRALQ